MPVWTAVYAFHDYCRVSRESNAPLIAEMRLDDCFNEKKLGVTNRRDWYTSTRICTARDRRCYDNRER